MIELIYVSRASKRYDDKELSAMLSTFRENNQTKNISGLLLYDGSGTFIQALEGDEETVSALLKKIRKDPRHSSVNLLSREEISARNFADWRMGFRNIGQQPLTKLKGFSDFLQHQNPMEYLTSEPTFATEMLDYFKGATDIDLDKD